MWERACSRRLTSGLRGTRIRYFHKQGFGRFDGLFYCAKKSELYISKLHNQMNKYDLKIYESPVMV